MMIKGHVLVSLKDKNGNVVQEVEGPNTAVEMSNNILMDCLYPVITEGQTWDTRTPSTNMTLGTSFPSGAGHIGPYGVASSDSSKTFATNMIGYIAIGSNINDGLGTNLTGPLNTAENQNSADNYGYSHSQLVTMVDNNFDITSATYCKSVMSVDYLASNAKVIKFSTTFDTTEGNVPNGVAEVGLWTIGGNASLDGQLVAGQPSVSSFMRLFAHRVLSETLLKTEDGSLDITYTLTFTS